MAERHIKSWAAFLTIFHRKNGYRTGVISVELVGDDMELNPEMDEYEGVTSTELADALGFSPETGRRRLKKLEAKGLVERAGGDKGYKLPWLDSQLHHPCRCSVTGGTSLNSPYLHVRVAAMAPFTVYCALQSLGVVLGC